MKMFVSQMKFVDASEVTVLGVFSTQENAVAQCTEASKGLEGTDTVLSVYSFEVDSTEQFSEFEWELNCEDLPMSDDEA